MPDALITIIAGSREGPTLDDIDEAAYECKWDISRVVSGCARGADQLGEQWAASKGISVDRFPAGWDRYGKSAGYRRNIEMADHAQALIAIWNGSPGTKHMIDIARQKGLRVYVAKSGDRNE